MSGIAERLESVLRDHGIYGFNGSQVACRCSQRNWRAALDWHAHVAEIQAELVEREIVKRLFALKAHADQIRDDSLVQKGRNEVVKRVDALAVEWERSGFDMEAGQLRAALSPDPDRGEGEA